MFNQIKAAIIDLDGTMVDTAPDFLVAINAMREEFVLEPLSIDTIKRMVGQGVENLVRRVLAVDFTEDAVNKMFDAALAAYQKHYLPANGTYSELYPKVPEGLRALRSKGLRLACVTNKPMAFTIPLLVKKDVAEYFDLVIGGDSLPRKKPDPMPLLHVCHEFNLEPAQVLVIGDSSNDAQAAHAAGCPVVLVPYGYNHGEAIQTVKSDGIVETLLDAAQLVSQK